MFFRIALVIVCLVLMQSYSVAERQKQKAEYIFWHLMPAEGATPEFTSKIERRLRNFFEKQQGPRLMSAMTMDSLLLVEGNEKYLRCGMGAVCLSGLGVVAGVSWVIAGQVKRSAEYIEIELILVDVAKKETISSAVINSIAPLKRGKVEELSTAMFEPERYKGYIDLSCAVKGANIFIDKVHVGVTPVEDQIKTNAGMHLLEIKKPGHHGYSRTIRVPVGSTKRVVALLPDEGLVRKSQAPFYNNWIFWSLGGAGLCSSLAGLVLQIEAGRSQDNADRAKEEGLNRWLHDQDLANKYESWSYVAFGIGGAGLIAAGVIAIIDSLGNQEEKKEIENRISVEIQTWNFGTGFTATVRF